MLCEYGCGKEALHQFKNGKWCCSRKWTSCLEVKVRRKEMQNRSEVQKKRSDERAGDILSFGSLYVR